MKVDHLFFQCLYQTSAKPHRLLGFKGMKHCPQHTLSQTAQNQSQLSYLDAPGEPDVPLPGLRIMTYAEHLNIELNLPLSYSIIIFCLFVAIVGILRERDVA